MLNLIRLPSYPLISDKFLVIIKKLQRIFLSLEAYTHGFCVFNELLVVVIRVLFEQISLNLKIDTGYKTRVAGYLARRRTSAPDSVDKSRAIK
jgi:hypothetical protein